MKQLLTIMKQLLTILVFLSSAAYPLRADTDADARAMMLMQLAIANRAEPKPSLDSLPPIEFRIDPAHLEKPKPTANPVEMSWREDAGHRKQPRAGDHSHRCPVCAVEWWHNDANLGEFWSAHKCPQCGITAREIYRRCAD